MDRTLTEMGIRGGLLGIREYYETRVIDYHRWILRDCINLRSEYASNIAIKVGYESRSNKPCTSVTTSVVTSTSVSRSESSKKLSQPNSSSSSSPLTGNRLVWLSHQPIVLCPFACTLFHYCILDLCFGLVSFSGVPLVLEKRKTFLTNNLPHELQLLRN